MAEATHLDGSQVQVPQSIRISVVEANKPERIMQICIIGVTKVNRSIVGYQPFIIGVDQIGHGQV